MASFLQHRLYNFSFCWMSSYVALLFCACLTDRVTSARTHTDKNKQMNLLICPPPVTCAFYCTASQVKSSPPFRLYSTSRQITWLFLQSLCLPPRFAIDAVHLLAFCLTEVSCYKFRVIFSSELWYLILQVLLHFTGYFRRIAQTFLLPFPFVQTVILRWPSSCPMVH